MTLKFTEECIQNLINADNWWIKDTSRQIYRGSLIQAYVPHVSQIPKRLAVAGRTEATAHGSAKFEIEPFCYGDKKRHLDLPVAALPAHPGEELLVFNAKRRPLLVIADNSLDVDKRLILGKPKWMTSPTLLVAPYYGRDEGTGVRSGFGDEFTERIRQCEYPQYLWDKLPLSGANESILRFDHIQPVGNHHDTYHLTDFRLNEDAMMIIDEWLQWYIFGCLDKTGILADLMRVLQKL